MSWLALNCPGAPTRSLKGLSEVRVEIETLTEISSIIVSWPRQPMFRYCRWRRPGPLKAGHSPTRNAQGARTVAKPPPPSPAKPLPSPAKAPSPMRKPEPPPSPAPPPPEPDLLLTRFERRDFKIELAQARALNVRARAYGASLRGLRVVLTLAGCFSVVRR